MERSTCKIRNEEECSKETQQENPLKRGLLITTTTTQPFDTLNNPPSLKSTHRTSSKNLLIRLKRRSHIPALYKPSAIRLIIQITFRPIKAPRKLRIKPRKRKELAPRVPSTERLALSQRTSLRRTVVAIVRASRHIVLLFVAHIDGGYGHDGRGGWGAGARCRR